MAKPGNLRHPCNFGTFGKGFLSLFFRSEVLESLAAMDTGVERVQGKEEDRLENAIVKRPRDQKPKHGEIPGLVHPAEITMGQTVWH